MKCVLIDETFRNEAEMRRSDKSLLYMDWSIGLVVRVFTKGLEDQGSILSRVIPKTLKMHPCLMPSIMWLWIKDKVEQSRERNSILPYTLV